jgi:hypothetical protein
MLPGSSFYYEDANGPCFELWQIRLILQSKYNLNHGHNLIPLPDLTRDVPIHKLIQHPGDHPVYTQLVMDKLRAVADAMDELKQNGVKHPELKEKVFTKLQRLETTQWNFLIKLGAEVANAGALGTQVNKEWVKYGTDGDPFKYEWGALF